MELAIGAAGRVSDDTGAVLVGQCTWAVAGAACSNRPDGEDSRAALEEANFGDGVNIHEVADAVPSAS